MSSAHSEGIRNPRSLGWQPLFTSLPQSIVVELERKLVFTRHAAGSVIYRQGDRPAGIFMICAGRIKIWAITLHDKTALLKVARPGEMLDLATCLAGERYLATAEATENSSVAFLSREDLLRSMQKYPAVSEVVVHHHAAACIEQATETLLLRVPCTSSQRLAAVLLQMANGHCNGSVDRPRLTYTHAELGQLIGASRETVTRLMKRFEGNAAIRASKSIVTITDQRALEQMAGLS